MRLVKATRPPSRRHLAVLALPLALVACEEPAPDDGAPGPSELCRMEAVLPLHPRLVVTPLHGEPKVLARDVCAACFAAVAGAWAVGDRDTIQVHVGDRFLEVNNERRSPLRASHALRGVALGHGAALLDLGATWLLWRSGEEPVEVPRLPLAPGQTVWALRRGHEAVTVQVRDEVPQGELVLPVLALAPPRPPELIPLDTPQGGDAGYLERAERGAAVLVPPGRRVELGDTRAVLSATLVGDTVLAWGAREVLVAPAHDVVEHVGAPDSLLVDDAELVWLESAPRRLRTVVGGAWATAWQARPGERFGGGALSVGAASIRLEGALRHGHVAIVERVQGADCGVADQLTLVDLDHQVVRTLADDAHLRLHIAPVDDGFGWIEADADRFAP